MSEIKMKVSVFVTKKPKFEEMATDFYTKLHTAYVTAAVFIQKKCALNNPLLNFFCDLFLSYASHL